MKCVALDTMVFIYHFDDDASFGPAAENILLGVQKGKTRAITSIISLAESLSPKKYLENVLAFEEFNRFFFEMANLTVFPVDRLIAQATAKLRQINAGLRLPDAMQLATALVHEADVLVTNDAQLLKLKHPPLPIQSLEKFSKR